MADRLCTRCGLRPPVAQVRYRSPSGEVRTADLCPVCLAETSAAAGGPRRDGLFDRFLRDMLAAGAEVPTPGQEPGWLGSEPSQPVNQIDITNPFSDALRHALERAGRRAMETGSGLEPEHLLSAILEDEAVRRLLERLDHDADAITGRLESSVVQGDGPSEDPALSPESKRVLLGAYQESRMAGATYIGPEHLLVALAGDRESLAGRILQASGVDQLQVRNAVTSGAADQLRSEASTTPTVDEFSTDLTDRARRGDLDPVVGRNDQIEQTIEILSRRTKNNPVLVGDAGVGKTSIVEGIAQRIVNDDVPETLAGKRLVNLELGGLLAGTRYRGDFEERLKTIMDEIREHADELLLFIDEIHTIVGAGGAEGAVDAANMLKPALARGELHVIGATTLDEYRTSIEKDPALERRFQPVTVPEPSVEDTIQILHGLKDRYEAFHCVRITDEAIDAAARLSDRYVADRFLPDKAIDLIDQAGARVRLRQKTPSGDGRTRKERIAALQREKDQAVSSEDYERAAELKSKIAELEDEATNEEARRQRAPEVAVEDIAEVVARRTGIPLSQLTMAERARLLHLEEQLHQRVIGQDDAVRKVAEAVRRSRAGLGDPDRPIGSFLFLGPTGVGKTELARTLAGSLFGDEDLMIRFDMSEFQERHTVSRLVGSPPGYVGYEDAGQLTERVRRRPYSVLLFDEIEKAHPDVFNVLLQLLDDGRVSDAHGRAVDFKNTVVIMTSNIGAERIHGVASRVGFRPQQAQDEQADFDALRTDLMAELRRHFRPEFLNRIDDIVFFRPLSREQVQDITRLLLAEIERRLAARHIGVGLTDDAVEHLAATGFDPDFGARPLRRAIQRELENTLSTLMLDGTVDEGDAVTIDLRDGTLDFTVERGAFEDGMEDTGPPPDVDGPVPAGPSAPRTA
jgi:ATP-dependent Clp protease ATP-binding subunit ClpC